MSEHENNLYRRTMENRFMEAGYIKFLLKQDGIEIPDPSETDVQRIKAEIKKHYPDYEFPQDEDKGR